MGETSDHDLLVGLNVRLEDIKADIKELKDGVSSKLENHEVRIRSLENRMVQVFTFGVAGLILLGIGEFMVNKFL